MKNDGAREPLGTQILALGTSFDAAAAAVAAIPDVEERAQGWRELATLLVGMPEQFRATAYRSHPELENALPFPDMRLSAAEQELVSRLDQSDLEVIDRALVENSVTSWRTVARVIGEAMVTLKAQFPSLPLGLYVRRIAVLVEGGALLTRGNADFMRLSEVRLSASVNDAEKCA
jgi:hypothetical protein